MPNSDTETDLESVKSSPEIFLPFAILLKAYLRCDEGTQASIHDTVATITSLEATPEGRSAAIYEMCNILASPADEIVLELETIAEELENLAVDLEYAN